MAARAPAAPETARAHNSATPHATPADVGAGMHSALAELCDGTVDGTVVARWPLEKDKDKTNIMTVLTVYGVAY